MLFDESIFSEKGLERIFEGEMVAHRKRDGTVNHYAFRGFHLEEAATMAKRCILMDEKTRTSPDSRGVYRARFTYWGKRRTGTFFPAGWTKTQVCSAIAEAYENRERFATGEAGSFYTGKTREGIGIILQLDDDDLVLDAIPQRAKVNRNTEAKFQIERGTIKSNRRVCKRCGAVKVRVCPTGHDTQRRGVMRYVRRARYVVVKNLWKVRRMF